jgi:DNA-binding GntR family transcriptional regulator
MTPGTHVLHAPRHLTKQQYVYEMVRHAILRCEYAPGTRLVIDDLARRFDVSIIPVREALRLLESEGLIANVPHVGPAVAPVSRASVVETFTILDGLEVVSTRAAARSSAAPRRFQDLDRLVHEMDRALADGKPGAWGDLNSQFHLAISRRCAMPMLEQMLQRALDHWDRVRRHFFRGVLLKRAAEAQREHHRIVSHIKSRDLKRLEHTIRTHNRRALAAYTAYLDAHPDEDGTGA